MRATTSLVLALLCGGFSAARAEECLPADPAKVIAAAKSHNAIVLEGEKAMAFAVEARSLGIPVPDPDYVFLINSGSHYQAEWMDGAKTRVAMACSWSSKPGSKFGALIARWAGQ